MTNCGNKCGAVHFDGDLFDEDRIMHKCNKLDNHDDMHQCECGKTWECVYHHSNDRIRR